MKVKDTKGGNNMNQKGYGAMMTFFTIIIGFILMVAFLPVLNTLMDQVNNTNMASLSMSNVIILLMGMMGLIMAILYLMGVVQDFQQRQGYQ